MLYPTTEYAYVDEYGQPVDPSNYTEQVYPDYNDQTSPPIIIDNNAFDNQQQQQSQYRPIVIDGSQPL